MQTSSNIGQAFEYVKKIEDYGPGGIPISNLGVWFSKDAMPERGLFQMLLELHLDFLLADKNNLDLFETLIIPSRPIQGDENIQAIREYIAQGGKVLFLAQGAMNPAESEFTFDVGAELVGPGLYDVDYTLTKPELGKELMQSPTLNYTPGFRISAHEETEIWADIYEPYFSRTYEHNCSNRVTPFRPEPSGHPALVKKGGIVFTAHPLDRMYLQVAARTHRDLFKKALGLVYDDPLLKVSLPSCGRVNLLHQADKSRYVAHLLYACPHSRGDLLLIEDLVPLHNIPVQLKLSESIKTVTLIPDNIPLEYTRDGEYINVVVPEFTMHCGVVFDY